MKDVLDWLIGPHVKILQNGEAPFFQAMTAFTKTSSLDYQRATEESLAILRWIRHLDQGGVWRRDFGGFSLL